MDIRSFRPLAPLAALAALCACTPDIPRDEPPAVVEAEFDPSAEPSPRIPSPTDLAYDAETGRIALETDEDDSDAQKSLVEFLDSLDGWPASMPAAASFLGVLDPASVTGSTVRVLDITDLASPQPLEGTRRILEGGGFELRVHPGLLPSWEPGRRYAVAVIGGEEGVRGEGGETAVPSPVFWFFSSQSPLAECRDQEALEGCRSLSSLIDDADVADLEEIRRENAEVFDALEAAGVSRGDIAVAWSFRTSTRAVVPFDPSVNDVHFPNDYYLSEDGTHLDVPSPEGSSPAAEALLARLSTLDGFSLTAPPAMRFVGPVDGRQTNLTPSSLLVLNADDDQDMPLIQRLWDEERGEVVLLPRRVLHSHTRYAAVATDYIADLSGEKIIPSHIWAILRSPFPAADAEGLSLLSGVSDEDARALEEARLEYQELFDTLETRLGIRREKVQVGVVFTTRTVVDGLQALRQRPFEASLPTLAASPGGVQDPADVVPAGIPRGNLSGVVMGTISGLDLLDPVTREVGAAPGVVVDLPFILTLPAAPPEGRALPPVVIFQHDLKGSRLDALLAADALAAEGYATIAIDLVGHGGRGVCLLAEDCDGGTCNGGTCEGGALRTDGQGVPVNAREVLFPVSNPFAAGEAMRQQAVDLVALVRSLRAADGPAAIPGAALDAGDISFLGVGFGAMAGAIFMAADPAVHVAVLSGPGGNLRALAEASSETAGAIDAWLQQDLGLEAGTEAYHFFRYAWSLAADAGDPAVYAHHLIDAPLPDPDTGAATEPRVLLVQVPENDEVIPLESQNFFFLSLGPQLYPEEFAGAGHDFILDPDDPAGVLGLAQAVTFIASGGETILPAGGGGR